MNKSSTTTIRLVIVLALLLLVTQSSNGQDWPQWTGPNGNFTADYGKTLLRDFSQARLIWSTTEDSLPVGAGQSPRYGGYGSDYQRPAGSGSSPIIGSGRVYMSYFKTRGPEYDTLEYRKRRPNNWRPEYWYLRADDVFEAFDQQTGKRLWRTVFPDSGINWADHKAGPGGTTTVYINNRIVGVGSCLDMYCLDATTGQVLWTSTAIPRRTQLKQTKLNNIRTKRQYFNSNRDLSENLGIASGYVIVSDYQRPNAGWMAIDPVNGNVVWRVASCHAEHASPTIVNVNGQDLIVGVTNAGKMTVINATTGAVNYTINNVGYNSFTLNQSGNKVFLNIGTGYDTGGRIGCYEIGLNSASLIWSADPRYQYPSWSVGCIPYNGVLYCRIDKGQTPTSNGVLMLDINTGRQIKFVNISSTYSTEAHAYASDGRLVIEQNSQHGSQAAGIFEADTALITGGRVWQPPHAQHTSYQTPISHPVIDGRIYIRGAYHIHCYDVTQPTGNAIAKISLPAGPATVLAGDSVRITATVVQGPVTKIEFYQDGQLIHTATSAPYVHTVPSLNAGTYYFGIKAYDQNNTPNDGEGVIVKSEQISRLDFWPASPDLTKLDTLNVLYNDVTYMRYQYLNASNEPIFARNLPLPAITTNAGPVTTSRVTAQLVGGPHVVTGSATVKGQTYSDDAWLTIAQRQQIITFNRVTPVAFVNSKWLLQARASSNLPVTLSVVSGSATIMNDTITFTGPGIVTIQASQPGNAGFAPASDVIQTVSVKVNQIATSIRVIPDTMQISRGSVAAFRALVLDQDGDVMQTQAPVSWQASGGGQMDSLGIFISDSVNLGRFTVTASAGNLIGQGQVSVISPKEILSFNFGSVNVNANQPAGYYFVPNWNNLTTSSSNAINHLGQSTTTRLTVTGSNGTYVTTDTSRSGDGLMMRSFRGSSSSNSTMFLNFSGLPAGFSSSPYEVIAYFQSHETVNKTPHFSCRGEVRVMKQNQATWSGQFTESTATNEADAAFGTNMVRFNNVTGDTLRLAVWKGSGATRFGISGLQLVGEGTIGTRQAQTILLTQFADRSMYSAPLGISAQSTSGLPVYLRVVSGPAYFIGNQLHFTGQPGRVTFMAYQPGNDLYLPATIIYRSFNLVLPTNLDKLISEPLEVFPNPTTGSLYFSTKDRTPETAKIINAQGQLTNARIVNLGTSAEIILGDLPRGVYQLIIGQQKARFVRE